MTTSTDMTFTGPRRILLYFALSRTPHGILDMTTPAFAALLWLGRLPSAAVIVIGCLTTFAGYTAIYALNDIVGYRSDRMKFQHGGFGTEAGDLDAVFIRHPMAQGYLSYGEGVAWAFFWGVIALAGAWVLNPVCVMIFAGGCLLEALYCVLWRVSPYRTLVSGAVKTLGAVAAVYAVDPAPDIRFVFLLFGCLFAWEVGGQNVPNDWADLEEDRRFGGKTIPAVFGLDTSSGIILWSNIIAVCLCGAMFAVLDGSALPVYGAVAVTLAAVLLLIPAGRLYLDGSAALAMALFNRASYFPLSMFLVAAMRVFLGP